MATTMNHQRRHHFDQLSRSPIQRVTIGIGVAFLVIGVAGILVPGLMGMHLSFVHNLIHLFSGALALWAGYARHSRGAYLFCLIMGTVYGFLGMAGYVLGTPGYPAVGQLTADQYLLRVIPNVLEFGAIDHGVHLFLGVLLLYCAYSWKRRFEDAGRSIVDVQRRREKVGSDFFRGTNTRPDAPNSETDLADAELGRSDVNRPSDLKRRDDFERRV